MKVLLVRDLTLRSAHFKVLIYDQNIQIAAYHTVVVGGKFRWKVLRGADQAS